MPTTTYMVVDPRHDHSMRIPRPDRTAMLGTPNACNSCHTDKTATLAQDAIRSWYPTPKPGAQDFAEAYERGDIGAPGAQKALQSIAAAGSASAIARASALARLSRYPSLDVLNMAAQALKIEDPLVRSAAIQVIAVADTATRRTLLVPLLRDKTKLVRMDAARALVGDAQLELPAGEAEWLQMALQEYVEAQLFNAERPETHANLGALYRAQGKLTEARAAFELATKIDPPFSAAFVSLAEIARSQGDEREAEAILRQALLKDVGSGMIHHALGLSLIRQKRTTEALTSLTSAAEATPEDPRFIYVLAIAQHDTGKRDEAIATLNRALARHPYDRDILWALASYEFEARDYSAALKSAEFLLELEPERADVAQLVGALKRQVK